MEHNPRDAYKSKGRQYLKDIGDAYVLNQSGTLYEPKSETAPDERPQDTAGTNRNSPFHVYVLRDWVPIILSALTLLLLGSTVFYAHKQWWEAQRTANASVNTFDEIQKQTIMMRQQIVGTQAAVIRTQVVFSPDSLISILPGITLQFLNNGKVSGTNFTAHIVLQRVSVPDFRPKGYKKSINIIKKRFPARADGLNGEEAAASAVFDTSDIGDSEIANIKNMESTVEINTTYSYGDGFGETIERSECSMFVYIVGRIPSENFDNWQDCEHAKNDYRNAFKHYR